MEVKDMKHLHTKEIANEKILLARFLEMIVPLTRRPDFVYDLQKDKCLYLSSAIKNITGQNCEEMFHKPLLFIKSLAHPIDYMAFVSEFIEFIKSERDTKSLDLKDFMKSFTFRVINKRGNWEKLKIQALYLQPDKIVGTITKNKNKAHFHRDQSAQVSPREIEVLELIASGNSAKIIGDKLNISETTVTTHRKHLKQKFNAKNTAELIREAAKANII